ncbi:MAG: DUF5677 domain-containing protein [Candidatus Saccharibacteria bacterium]|nr:DUF5677 domain-containing protein [Candidatus Saccharibacteria bacterium]
MAPEDILPERFQPDSGALEKATSEGVFVEAAFYLAQECGVLSVIISNLKPRLPATNLSQTIDMAMIVRLSKLMKLLIRDISNNETYGQLSISRQMLETAATLVYLLHDDGSGDRYLKYIQDSLVSEKEIMKQINQNIKKRGGKVLKIEKRMEESILETATAAGITSLDSIPPRGKIGFPKFEERVMLLGGPTVYVGYRSGSAEIHGTWTDLFKHHLMYSDEMFYPNNDEPPTRPHVATTATSILSRVLVAYIDSLQDKDVTQMFEPLLKDITERNHRVVDLHEKYLNKKHSGAV